ncbi:MAG: Purine nucleoside phosphorylase [Candidatus Magasanikbacteria bacterium GW2011_GWA2_56_11]|uniref:Purine nucleoside phosphorylase n=1 Tax=Candidatus Magasanikbacteria bacterium GW2011_GWA2_56_11 TaxID=1619044 RepID=A0A0G1YDN9_9BACT|nr:MAG: Purine nucleoside phosphorylase [Candidatus Magasanikbacteria bacterium GW2011_GWA2_56_11]
MQNVNLHRVRHAAERISSWMGGDTPTLGIVLGSGLGTKFVESLGPLRSIGYSDLGLPQPSIAGHPGRLHYAPVGSERVLVLQGRVHCYEGRDLEEVVLAVRALAFAGASTFVLTCAAGAVYPELKPGQLVAISDHVNLTFRSPLTGHNVADTGPRFPDMTQAYDRALIEHARAQAECRGISLPGCVYAMMPGPQYETPAEIRMLRTLGADLAGMSTVPEAIALRHLGKRVLALACVTNYGAGIMEQPLSHEEVTQTAAATAGTFSDLLLAIVRTLPPGA